MEFKVRSNYEERYGKRFVPGRHDDPGLGHHLRRARAYYDKFEYTAAISARPATSRARSSRRQSVRGAARARYPLPPLTRSLRARCSRRGAEQRLSPVPAPSANASRAYTNPDGAKFGACQYCGYCQRFGCEANAKGSPHITVIPIALRNPNFELRTIPG
jgi:gluconate 2-dehydrogenase alpha chain